MSQEKLAILAGVGRLWLAELEKGKPGAPLNLVLKTLGVLGYEIRISDVSAWQFTTGTSGFNAPMAGANLLAADRATAVSETSDRSSGPPATRSPIEGVQIYEESHGERLMLLIAQIVRTEAPIFENCLAKRAADSLGLSRASKKFSQLVTSMTEGQFTKSSEGERVVVWAENAETDALIPFRETKRHHFDIPLAELAWLARECWLKSSTLELTLAAMRQKLHLASIRESRSRFVKAIDLAKQHLPANSTS
ncbi:hypothetical protein BSZ21_20995 [Bradyrhizobium canariense]|nr:hypothetical protein BSZ21_20995 [Bradyrhizobium canariense]